MKRYIITLLLIECISLQLSAQNKKRSWGEVNFALEQNFMLNKWFDDPEINRLIPSMNVPFLTLGLEVRVYEELGLFWNMGVSIQNKKNGFSEKTNFFPELNIEDYYQSSYYNYELNRGREGKNIIGIFYKFHKKNWIIAPQIGYGMMDTYNSSMIYSLKTKGTNEKYFVEYNINRYLGVSQSDYLMLKLKAQRKLSNRFLLNLSAEYNLHFTRVTFEGEYSNYYNNITIH